MRKQQTSLTALGIAITRAVESSKPAGERIVSDPYARRFIPGWLYHLMAFFINSGYSEWRGPGVMGWLVARDRYVDDCLQRSLETGLEQLVILGAGYDSRPYRFAALKDRAKTFEVDHPASQKDKLAKLVQIFGQVPGYVTYVPVDFNTQALDESLIEAGYDPTLKTLFIWQGVSMYLAAEAVDATLAFVSGRSAPGSAIVFDYIYQAILEGRERHGEVSGMRRYRFMSGEALTFGIEAEEVEEFLKTRGYREVIDVNAQDLHQAYFQGENALRKVASGYGIATGVV